MYVSDRELKEFILDSGIVARKEIDVAEKEAQEREHPLGDMLVSRGALTEDALRRVQSYILGIPFVNLKEQSIPVEVFALIPEPIARTHNIIAYKKTDDSLEVALLDVEDIASIDSVQKKTGLKILPRLTDTESIKHALLKYQKSLRSMFGDIISTEALKINTAADGGAEDPPIVRIVDTLLRHAIVHGASDIHIEPMENEVLIRYRIGGSLHDAMTLPKMAAEGIAARIKMLSGMKPDEKLIPQDGQFKMEIETDRVSFRASILPTFFGEKAILRLLRETGEGFTLEVLGFHGEGLERVHHALRQKAGIILVSGPADSGKTTTLYTLLDILNRPDITISTIENPVEYQMQRVNQTQIHPLVGLTFADGLRALMRQDPDVIMVGDIRDEETASLAVSAASAGHLVLAGITANSAAGALARLVALGVPPFLLASTVRAVIGQRLSRKLSEQKKKYEMNRSMRTEIASEADFLAAFKALQDEKLMKKGSSLDDVCFYKPALSAKNEDGYKNRIGIHEVLRMSLAIQEILLHSGTKNILEAQAKKEGMLTLLQDGLYAAARGLTSIEEAMRAVAE